MATKKTILRRALMSGLITILLLLLTSASSFAQEQNLIQSFKELDLVKSAVSAHHAHWEPGVTSVSQLPPEFRKRLLGLVETRFTGKEEVLTLKAERLPSSLDWRDWKEIPGNDVRPGNYVTPVRNQIICGSCWAFATTGALESYQLIKDKTPLPPEKPGEEPSDLHLAEQILVSCSTKWGCCGAKIDEASNFIRDTGLPVESCFPYNCTSGSCSDACSGWQSGTYKIGSWRYVTTKSPTVDAIKKALYNYGPLVAGMNVCDDFFSYKKGTYSHVYGAIKGSHAILIIGYDDTGKYFIAKNSWGTDWGKEGYFQIAYSQVTSPVEFGHSTITYLK